MIFDHISHDPSEYSYLSGCQFEMRIRFISRSMAPQNFQTSNLLPTTISVTFLAHL